MTLRCPGSHRSAIKLCVNFPCLQCIAPVRRPKGIGLACTAHRARYASPESKPTTNSHKNTYYRIILIVPLAERSRAKR